jgi:TPR repeat protein
MNSWQGIELEPELHQLAERAALKAGIPVEQWIERSIRRACPAAFEAPVVAPPPAPPRSGFDPAPKNKTNGIDPSLAELIAAARVPRQPAAPAPAPEVNATEPGKNILDYMFRRRRFAGPALPAQKPLDEPAPEQSGDLFDERPRLKLRRSMPVEHDIEPVLAPAASLHREDARAPWPSFKDRGAPEEGEDLSSPLELTPPMQVSRSRKSLVVDIAVALVVFIGVLGAQRYLSMMASKPEAQDQSALDSTSDSAATSMPALQPSAPPPDQSAAQTSPPAETPAAETPPAAGVAPPPQSAASNQPATAAPQPAAEADTTSRPNPTPPAVIETLPQRKVAAVKPPAMHATPLAAAPPTSTAAKKPIPGPGEESQDPAKLAAWLQDRAKANDPVAQYRLGVLYALGQGVKQDYGQAAQLFLAAANGGVAEAQYNVAVMYSEGMGVPRDPAQAINWYQKAAAQGNANAAFNLGVAYSNGIGVQQDIQEAVRWFRRAATAGVINAQFNLGVLYERGEGVPQSATEAYAWYTAAAAHGDQGAAQRRDHLAGSLSPTDLQKAQERAAELQKTIQTGSAAATVDQKANAAKP